MYTVKIENVYGDGHESTTEVVLPAPAEGVELAEWFSRVVYPHTGDGHGIGNDLGSYHSATITACDHAEHLGVTKEWD